MRRTLALLSAAVTAMVALAFLIPLGLVVQQTARARALDDAERQAASVVPALAITADPATLRHALASTPAGALDRIGLHLANGSTLGTVRASAADVDRAARARRTSAYPVRDGYAVLEPARLPNDRTAVVEVYLADGDLTKGVPTAWITLGLVALVLVLGSVVVADRLGARVVRAARRLGEGARALGDGRLDVRVDPAGPAELRAAGRAFNAMAERLGALVAAERELAADLSHRLRTPLTALRLNVDHLGDTPEAEQSRLAVARLEREVDEIIDATRRADGEEPATCDAARVVRERMGFWSALAEDQGRLWRVVGGERVCVVPVSRPELSAVVDALVGNVFRHTPERSAYEIELLEPDPARPDGTGGANGRGGAVEIVVSDAGPGIADPEAASRRGASGVGSSGLGLDIARRLAASTGGGLAIGRSVLGGAQVRLRLETARLETARPGDGRTARPGDGRTARPGDG